MNNKPLTIFTSSGAIDIVKFEDFVLNIIKKQEMDNSGNPFTYFKQNPQYYIYVHSTFSSVGTGTYPMSSPNPSPIAVSYNMVYEHQMYKLDKDLFANNFLRFATEPFMCSVEGAKGMEICSQHIMELAYRGPNIAFTLGPWTYLVNSYHFSLLCKIDLIPENSKYFLIFNGTSDDIAMIKKIDEDDLKDRYFSNYYSSNSTGY